MKVLLLYNLNSSNKKEIALKINEEITKTQKSITKLIELTKPIEPDCAIGRISRMDAINNKTINENALRNATAKLTALQNALQNIDDNDFGTCIRCKNEIPLGRILLMPQSRFCVYCAGK